jgi:hypothetical protein
LLKETQKGLVSEEVVVAFEQAYSELEMLY